jgi:hypothetical protein
MARYHDMLTVEMPNKIEAMIRQGDTRNDIAQQRTNIQEQNAQTNAQRAQIQGEAAMLNARAHIQIADAAGSRAQTAKQTLDFNAAKASVTQLNVVASQLNKDYDSIQKSINQMVLNGGDPGAKGPPGPDGTPGPSLFDQLAEVGAKRDVTIQQQMDTTQFVQSQGTNAYRAASGFQSGQITGQNDTQPIDPTGRFQTLYQNGQPAGTFDTQTNKYQPFGGATQPTGGIPGGQPRAQGINAGPKLPPKNPANNSVGQPPKDMKPGTVEFFKTLTPQQQVQYMKSPKVPVEVKQYLRSIAPKTNDDQARQHAQGHTMGGAGGGRAMDENTNHIISNTARSNSDPWASVSQIQQGYEPAYRMGAGAQTLQDMSKAGANVFQQIGQGVGAAGKAIGGTVQGIENFGKTINSGSRAQGPPTGKPIETQDAQAKLAQAALPVVKQELDSGKPVTQILMEMSQHGITHDTAMRILQQLHAAGYQHPQMPGGSEGANPKGANLPPGLLGKIEKAESAGGNPAFEHSNAGAEGPFQFMPGTAKEYGVQNSYDLVQSAQGAAKYLAALGSEFHGNWAKAVAGYNAGGGAVETAVKKYGQDWLAYMPHETQNYVAEVLVGQ